MGEALQQERQEWHDTVDEGINTVNELVKQLNNSRSMKQRAMAKYKKLEQQYEGLKKENRSQLERIKQRKVHLQAVTRERNDYFDKVQALEDKANVLQHQLYRATNTAGAPLRNGGRGGNS